MIDNIVRKRNTRGRWWNSTTVPFRAFRKRSNLRARIRAALNANIACKVLCRAVRTDCAVPHRARWSDGHECTSAKLPPFARCEVLAARRSGGVGCGRGRGGLLCDCARAVRDARGEAGRSGREPRCVGREPRCVWQAGKGPVGGNAWLPSSSQACSAI